MPAPAKQNEWQSTIGALHARYEASFDEYNIVDNAQGAWVGTTMPTCRCGARTIEQ